jgi:RNA polymerase sigma-70 factor (ECF subfamily)
METDDGAAIREAVRAGQRGDRQALGLLFDRFHRRVARLCLSFPAVSQADADDLVQEVFVRAFRGLSGLREPERFEPWLLSIARRRCLTHLGRAARARAEELDEAALPAPGDGEAQAERALELKEVAAAAEGLPDSSAKQAGFLFYRDGLDTGQIAAAMGAPVSTVTTWLDRFRQRVRRDLVARLLAARSGRED